MAAIRSELIKQNQHFWLYSMQASTAWRITHCYNSTVVHKHSKTGEVSTLTHYMSTPILPAA